MPRDDSDDPDQGPGGRHYRAAMIRRRVISTALQLPSIAAVYLALFLALHYGRAWRLGGVRPDAPPDGPASRFLVDHSGDGVSFGVSLALALLLALAWHLIWRHDRVFRRLERWAYAWAIYPAVVLAGLVAYALPGTILIVVMGVAMWAYAQGAEWLLGIPAVPRKHNDVGPMELAVGAFGFVASYAVAQFTLWAVYAPFRRAPAEHDRTRAGSRVIED